MEQLDLSTPVTRPNVTSYRVVSLTLDWDGARIGITLVGSDGVGKTAEYTGTTATTLMSGLNTANLSTKSLHRRILERLQTDGILGAGNFSGTPA